MRVVVLHNAPPGGAPKRRRAADAIAVADVLSAAAAVVLACRENGWDADAAAAPEEPRALLRAIESARPDVVFHMVEEVAGDPRGESAVACLLEAARIPYTGSPPLALAIGLEKPLARACLDAAGIHVAPAALLVEGSESLEGIRFPAIVKPSGEDASHGIESGSVVRDEAAARARARWVIESYDQPALVEEFLPGREFHVGVLGGGDSARALAAAEVEFIGREEGDTPILTYAAKWIPGSIEARGVRVGPAGPLDARLRAAIAAAASGAYRALGLRDYGRVDVRLDREGRPAVIEVNPNPDLSPGEALARAAAWEGITHAELVRRIVEAAAARGPGAPRALAR